MRQRSRIAVIMLLAGAAILAACGGGGRKVLPSADSGGAPTGVQTSESCPPGGSAGQLTGAGATFPFPLYSRWMDEYSKACSVKINYQSIGSGGGIRQITERTVDFGASDGIMTDQQERAAVAAGGPILHIPMTTGTIAVVYNLPGIPRGQIKLTPDLLADIYLKKIDRWNDARIAAENPAVRLPNRDIVVVHRSDGSGTTFVFTNYLSKVSQEWKDRVGNATSVRWPGDIGGEGNEGVANQVRQLPGAIGYVELAYATQNNLPWASLRNKSGRFLEPSIAATSAAAVGVTLPDDLKIMLTDSDNPNAYPITGFTWMLVYQSQPNRAKAQTLVAFLWWAAHDGQRFAEPLHYAPLSRDAVAKVEAQLRSITSEGEPLLR